jgi:hypothetical protein
VRRRQSTARDGARGMRRRGGGREDDDDEEEEEDKDDDDIDVGTTRARAVRVRRARDGTRLNLATVWTCAAYVTWVLMGTVAWVSHLGERAPMLAMVLPARGWPSNAACDGVGVFLARNAPLSLIFVIPHSLALPSRLYGVVGVYGRLVYNVISAAMLHVFLWAFTPLKTPVVRRFVCDDDADDATVYGARAKASTRCVFRVRTAALNPSH